MQKKTETFQFPLSLNIQINWTDACNFVFIENKFCEFYKTKIQSFPVRNFYKTLNVSIIDSLVVNFLLTVLIQP